MGIIMRITHGCYAAHSTKSLELIGAEEDLMNNASTVNGKSQRPAAQRVCGWVGIGAAGSLLWFGFYVLFWLDITRYAGSGTYPGTQQDFFDAFLAILDPDLNSAWIHWFSIVGCSSSCAALHISVNSLPPGVIVMIGGGITLAGALALRFLDPPFGIVPLAVVVIGVIIALSGVNLFLYHYWALDADLYQYYVRDLNWADVYFQQLQLHDTGVFPASIILGSLEGINAGVFVAIDLFRYFSKKH